VEQEQEQEGEGGGHWGMRVRALDVPPLGGRGETARRNCGRWAGGIFQFPRRRIPGQAEAGAWRWTCGVVVGARAMPMADDGTRGGRKKSQARGGRIPFLFTCFNAVEFCGNLRAVFLLTTHSSVNQAVCVCEV
jgi:hypothetical protein